MKQLRQIRRHRAVENLAIKCDNLNLEPGCSLKYPASAEWTLLGKVKQWRIWYMI